MPDDNRTPARQFRLPEDTMAGLETIAVHYALGSRAAAIRFLVVEGLRTAGLAAQEAPPKPLKKIPKKRR